MKRTLNIVCLLFYWVAGQLSYGQNLNATQHTHDKPHQTHVKQQQQHATAAQRRTTQHTHDKPYQKQVKQQHQHATAAQVPFNPPNVGGWPAGELWLTSAAAQFRLNLANLLVKSASLKDLKLVSPSQRVQYLKNHLGVYQWSKRTEDALTSAKSDPERLLLLAINSP